MRWKIIIEEFGPNIQHIATFDNIVADALSRFPSTPGNKYKPSTMKAQFHVNDLFAISRVKKQ